MNTLHHTEKQEPIGLCCLNVLIVMICVLFTAEQVSYGYGSGAHVFITGEGIDAYLAWVNQDNDGRVGEVVATHRDEIVLGSWQEDVPSERVLDHFWDPKTGEGWLPLIGKSALERAEELYANALSAYENEVYGGGGTRLAHTITLAE